ncbi:MAG: hypothetical protein HYV16_14530 [Gammaproteobacteria bacterium]|nr:hypothetical protein [Gammaproteobacteria bacterium]
MRAYRFLLPGLILGLSPVTASWAISPQQETTCQQWADEEGLKGEERESYLRRCREQMEADSLPPMEGAYPGMDSLFSEPPQDHSGN